MPKPLDNRVVASAYPRSISVVFNVDPRIDPEGPVDNSIVATGVYRLFDAEGNDLGERSHESILWSGKAVPSLAQIASAIGSKSLSALADGIEAFTGDRPV